MKTKLSLPITSLQSKKGFTIIEFMIATALFSVVLLVFSAVFTMIGKLFYKGYITSKTQEASRDLMYELSRNVQFSSGAITTGPNFLCIGGADYTITLNSKVTTTTHALQRTSTPAGGGCVADSSSPEKLPANMRLTEFSVTPQGSSQDLYNISIALAYGESDLMEIDPLTHATRCKGNVGSQFCAISALSKTVVRRIQ